MLVAAVRVGSRSVTGAGSWLLRDVPPDSLVAGVPAVIKKSLVERKDEKEDDHSEVHPSSSVFIRYLYV